MELHKTGSEEIRGWDRKRRLEAADQIRRQLSEVRMDIYSAKGQKGAQIRSLRRALARVLTVERAARTQKPKA